MRPWVGEDLIKPTTRGFVYLIVNTVTKRMYIGKKKTISEIRVAVEGRVNKKKITKPSNWKSYYGSCLPLKQDIVKLGFDKFDRYILGAFDELHSVNYAEAHLQFELSVLMEDGHFYNGNIKVTCMRPPLNEHYITRVHKILKDY